MSEAATPVEQNGGTPPAVPAATPANSQPEKVTLDKEAHDQLVRDAARASEAQSRADRYENVLKKNGLLGGGHFKPASPATPPTPEERQVAAAEEDREAEKFDEYTKFRPDGTMIKYRLFKIPIEPSRIFNIEAYLHVCNQVQYNQYQILYIIF